MVNALLIAGVLAAQGAPQRPLLPQRADLNDWQAYFDYGAEIVQRYPNRADSAFYWASRLDPSRAEPLFARWVTFWMTDIRRFERYLEEDPLILDSPQMRALDTLYLAALQRNPFVPQTLAILPYDQLPGRWREDLSTRGWLAYSRQHYSQAAVHFGRLIRRNPEKFAWVRFYRALVFVPMRAYDSATVEMTALLATLRARADSQPLPSYQSLEVITYGIGLLHLAQGHVDSARRAFEQAVEENLAFFPAHAALGDLALARFQRTTAARNYQQAAELAPDEAWIQHRYGVGLLRVGRAVDALAPLERAIALEPWYAEPYLMLGRAWEAAGDKAAAAKAYEQYLQRAPRRETEAINDAKHRLAAARGNGS